METGKIIASGIGGTALMTIFSYLVSEIQKNNFKEPERLAQLLEQLPFHIKKEAALSAGWAGHCGMGAAWALLHTCLFKKGLKPDMKNTLILGVLSGAAGIAIWKLMFRLHPSPPPVKFRRFAGHLLLAHLVYMLPVSMINRR